MDRKAEPSGIVAESLNKGVDKALGVTRPTVLKHIDKARRKRPDATPAEVIDALGRRFTTTVAGTGAAAGASAAAPGVNLPVSVALAAGDATGFMAAAMLYVLALAEIYDIPVDDLDRRKTLLLGVLLGDAGVEAVHKVAGRTGKHWAGKIVTAIPSSSIKQVNKVLGPRFVTKYGSRQGVLVLGKQVPFGFGAAIGSAGNAMFARFTVRSANRAFGPAPDVWPARLTRPTESGSE